MPLPTLGLLWGPSEKGYGQVRPPVVFNGGGPHRPGDGHHLALVGRGHRRGTGTTDYVGPGHYVATGAQEPAIIVAFDLGTCDGHPAYQAVEWYFPQHVDKFDLNNYINACTGAYVGNG